MTMRERSGGSYRYTGPLALGSIVSHTCAAVGLFVTRTERSDYVVEGREEGGQYHLSCTHGEDLLLQRSASVSAEGRARLQAELLEVLRASRGLTPSPWGTLVGVRPMKLYHLLGDRGFSEEERASYLQKEKQVFPEKIALMQRIGRVQAPVLERGTGAVSVYGGIPFCPSHCSYCSFPYGLIARYPRVSDFVDTFCEDCAELERGLGGQRVASLYLGGGTPTSLSDDDFAHIVTHFLRLGREAEEITVEAGRPDTLSLDKIRTLRRKGVTRVSLNPQTMQDRLLRRVGRTHSVSDVERLYRCIRQETDCHINMDFIAGLPDQTMADMVENIDYVCQQRPENVTIHTLALKRGSPLYAQKEHLVLPEVSAVADMVAYCAERLEREGYVPYYLYRQQYMGGAFENVGYTLPGFACRYNIYMMEERQSIVAVGPGSTTKIVQPPQYRQRKFYMPKDVDTYIRDRARLFAKRNTLLASG